MAALCHSLSLEEEYLDRDRIGKKSLLLLVALQ